MKELTVKICVLGGGPAGYAAAIRAAQLGASVALAEKDELGGTCLNRGCIPTKALLKTADVYETVLHAGDFGVTAEAPSAPDKAKMFARKDAIVHALRSGLELLMKKNSITVCIGTGVVKSSQCVEVRSEQELTVIHCEKLILAAGSAPLLPPIPGADSEGVLTSDSALSCAELPESIVIVGGGVVGLEFAAFYRSLGSTVTVVEMLGRILPGEDEDVSGALLRALKKRGIKFKLGAKVLGIDRNETGLTVKIEQNGTASLIASAGVLVAVGRKLCGLSPDVEALGVKSEKGAITVDGHMRTSVKNVYAAGDAVGGRLLAHLAFAEGRTAAENAMGLTSEIGGIQIPACVYTEPEFTSVGLSESAAKAAGCETVTGTFDFRANGRSLTLNNRDGFVKVVAEKSSGTLLGGCILGPEASEMISELTLAVTMRANISVLADMIHPHPSLSEAIGEACMDALGRAVHK